MKLSVCTESVYNGMDIREAMGRLKTAGFNAFEFWGWWNKDVEAVAAEKDRLGLTVAAFCTRMESLVDPARRHHYLEGLRESIVVAKRLGCRTLISQTGQDTGASREEQHRAMLEALRECAPLLEQAEVTLVLEPLNTKFDHVGYYLYSSAEALAAVQAVGSPCVKMLFDIYHQQIMEGDIIRGLQSCLGSIGHVHAAGNPGRHELYSGELDYVRIFAALRALGYSGGIGLEYFPEDPAEKGLAYARSAVGQGPA